VKSLRLRLGPAADSLHPVHRAPCESPSPRREYVLRGRTSEGVGTPVACVEEDREAYEGAIEATPEVRDVEITADGDDGFIVYLRAEVRESDRRLGDALTRETVVRVPPVVERGDGTMELTPVGHPSDLQAVVDELPAGVDVERVRVSDRPSRFERVPTRRQREAPGVAWDAGYYEQPREATLAEVAERPGAETGATSELLGRAERALVRSAVGTSWADWNRVE
jgi:hypothetical protein